MLKRGAWACLALAAAGVLLPASGGAAPVQESFSFAGDSRNTSIAGSLPPGTSVGDLLIAIMVTDGDSETLTAPAGWTAITGNIGSAHTSRSWYRIAGSSEPGSYTFTVSSNEAITLGILRFSGHDPVTPINISGTATGASVSPTSPSVTTTAADALILRYYGADDDDYTGDDTGYPPGHTGVYRRQSGGTGESHQGVAYVVQASVGATGTASFTQDLGEQWSAVTIAIAPTSAVAPNITFVKSVDAYSDPVNGTVNPKAIPGAEIDYTTTVTNTGTGATDNNTVVFTDSIPANMELFVGDLGLAGSGPIEFQDGSTLSGLSYTFINLGSPADDVTFFDSSGEFTPSPDGDGYDSAVVSIEVNPKGQFDAASGGNTPSFTLRFRVRAK
jgi:uncharacterized repeat protein (TIGR01451 family)